MRVLLLIGLSLCLSLNTWAQAQKFGHVDTQTLLLELPERATMEEEIKVLAKKFNDQVAKMENDLNTEITTTKTEAMSNEEYDVFLKKIQMERSNIDNYRQQCITSLTEKEIEFLTPMANRVKAAIKVVAEAGNYAYIFELSQIQDVYPGNTSDITALVRAELQKTIPTE